VGARDLGQRRRAAVQIGVEELRAPAGRARGHGHEAGRQTAAVGNGDLAVVVVRDRLGDRALKIG
jgi:hypothetical protein